MRLSGYIHSYKITHQNNQNQKTSTNNALKILTIGESTTEGTGAKESWPKQLENELNKRGIDTVVYNLARAALTSTFLIERIDKQIDAYNPDIVISMMGVNDNSKFYLKEINYKDAYSFFKSIRIVKLAHYIYDLLNPSKEYIFEYNAKRDHSEDLNIKETKRIVSELQTNGLNTKISNQIKKYLLQFSDLEKAKYYTYLAEQVLEGLKFDIARSNTSILLFEESFKFSFNIAHGLERYILYISILNKNSKCINIANILLKSDFIPTEVTLSRLLGCSKGSENKIFWKKFSKSYGFEFLDNASLPETKNSYITLAKKLKARKITYVAMQYPTLSISDIKSYYKDSTPPDFFVENKKNFEKAILEHGTKSIFSDLFAGSFGHTTDLGNRYIVKKLLPLVIKISKDKSTN